MTKNEDKERVVQEMDALLWSSVTITIHRMPDGTVKQESVYLSMNGAKQSQDFILKIISTASGISLVLILLAMSWFTPEPTPQQLRIWLAVLSIAGAAFAATVPGFLKVNMNLGTRLGVAAGGAIAVLVLFYFFNPSVL